MTETQLRAKIAYCQNLREKYGLMEKYFNSKLADLWIDLYRMQETLSLMDQA